MQKYRLVSKKGEGTFSEVLKAQVRAQPPAFWRAALCPRLRDRAASWRRATASPPACPPEGPRAPTDNPARPRPDRDLCPAPTRPPTER